MPSILKEIFDFIFPRNEDGRLIKAYHPDQIFRAIPSAPMDLQGLIRETNHLMHSHTKIHAIWQYRTPLARALIWQLKYEEDRHAAQCAGYALLKHIEHHFPHILHPSHQWLMIPIPLSKQRRKERGYNQSEWIIEEAFRSVRNDILIRSEHRDRQTKKGRRDRIHNAENIFIVPNPSEVFGKKCLVIDDVVTTGSTFISASTVLYAAGADEVACIALAH